MQCIFCLETCISARSVEHIIPESLGNTEHVLPRGVVCDVCNNYFAVKIEKPILETIHFMNLRGRNQIPNKRGLIPFQYGLCPGARIPVAVRFSETEGTSIGAWNEKDDQQLVRYLQERSSGCVYVSMESHVNERLLARFLGKVGYEILAQRAINAGLGVDELITRPELALLRNFVRRGNSPQSWPVHRRRIYAEDHLFDSGTETYAILHEYTLLFTDEGEVYAVVCLFGEEFVVNLGGPSIEGYERWIYQNNGRSPLYNVAKPG